MYEFVVWDKNLKRFEDLNCTWLEFGLEVEPTLVNSGAVGYERIATTNISVHNYIGKKDINDEKIYADSSIVEFEALNGINTRIEIETGVFRYNSTSLRYEIQLIIDGKYGCQYVYNKYVVNLKIIDTIQENKLGLIK